MNLKSLFLTFSALPMLGFGLPSGALVERGQADFHAPHASQLEISCHDRTVINWDTFNIDSHEALKFIQSQGDAVLNRVTGHESGLQMSQIMGTLSSQGSVYIVNPEGILIGSNALIDVASFVATTLDISSSDFLKLQSQDSQEGGLKSLILSGDSKAKILNLGTIKTASGDVHVVAYQVDNQGSIEATQGTVTLAAANEAVLQPAGKKKVLIRTRVNADSTDESAEADLTEEGVTNSGVIKALEADIGADGSLYKLAINHIGHIEAKTLTEEGGKIFLTSEKGSITVDGSMTAKQSIDDIEKGGRVEVMGERVALTEKAHIDVSGKHGGGVALFGSDMRGEGTAFNAQHTTVAKGSFVNASATKNGNGGKVIYWGDDLVNYHGSTLAEGGLEGGDGGFVEVSSHGAGFNKFKVTGHVSTLAPKGKVGTLLWDPDVVEIYKGTGEDQNVVSTTGGDYTFGAGDSARIYSNNLKNVLASNNVQITVDVGGSITFVSNTADNDPMDIDPGQARTLTLTVDGGSGGGVYFDHGVNAGTSTSRTTLAINAPRVEFGSVDLDQDRPIRIFATNIDITLNQNNGYVGLHSSSDGYTDIFPRGDFTVTEATGIEGGQFKMDSSAAHTNGTEVTIENTSGDITIAVSGAVTLHGKLASVSLGYDVGSSGNIKIGTSASPVESLTLTGSGSGIDRTYIGSHPSASSPHVQSLEVHTTGDVNLISTGEHDAAWISIGTPGTPLTMSVGGDINLTNAGGTVQINTQLAGAASPGTANIEGTGALVMTNTATGSDTLLKVGQAEGETVFANSITMTDSGAANNFVIDIANAGGNNAVGLGCTGDINIIKGKILLASEDEALLGCIGEASDIRLSNGASVEASCQLAVSATRDIVLPTGESYIKTRGGNYDLALLANREVIVNGQSYLSAAEEGSSGNLIVVTDNANSSAPDVGIGNLTMSSNASLTAAEGDGNIYVFAGYQLNNHDDINASATFNGTPYSQIKGELDVPDANNKFGIYSDGSFTVPTSYAAPATFYYKAFTPDSLISAGQSEGASEIASAAASSLEISISSGINQINWIREGYNSPVKSFYTQYGRINRPRRLRNHTNKVPDTSKNSEETGVEPVEAESAPNDVSEDLESSETKEKSGLSWLPWFKS